MKIFDLDNIDALDEKTVRHLLKSEIERNRLLVRQNKFMLFRYEVADDLMVILFEDADKTTKHLYFENYSKYTPGVVFSEEEHSRLIGYLNNIANDPNFAKTGAFDFHFLNGNDVTTEYTCLFDKEGKVIAIVGQNINSYQTHENMLNTISLLNEQVAITDTLRQTYETMISIDLENYSFDVLKGTPEVRFTAQKCKTVMDLAELFCNHFIEPEYHEGFKEFVSNITINERLAANRYIVFEYPTRNIGWCRARIISGETDSRGKVKTVIFTTEKSGGLVEEITDLRVAATTDALTGLKNRYSGETAINEILERKEPAIFTIFDYDHFKEINDHLGHPIGDQLLIEVAKALKDVFPSETIMRLGGDEFVLFITSRDTVTKAIFDGIEPVLQPLRDRLQNINIKALKGRKTMSAGAVIINDNASHKFEEIYEIADRMLYQAKMSHKGQAESTIIW